MRRNWTARAAAWRWIWLFAMGAGLLWFLSPAAQPAAAQAPDFVAVDPQAPQMGTWSTVTGSSGTFTRRHEAAYAAVNGRFYLLGGRGNNDVDVYDPVSNSWTQNGKPPQEIHHFQAVVYQGLVYLMGAMTGGYPYETPLPFIYIYDPETDTWYEGPQIPAARRRGGAGAVVYNDRIYVVGGIVNGHVSGTQGWLDEFDPATGVWTALPNDMPNARDHFHVAVVGDKLYAVGGRKSSAFIGSVFDDEVTAVDVYDFGSGTWSTLAAPIPTKRAGLTVAVLNGEVLAVGGESSTQFSAHDDTEALDPATNTFSAWDTLVVGRHGIQAVVYQNQVYVTSGGGTQGGNLELTDQECFTLAAASCTAPAPGPDEVLAVPAGLLDFGDVGVGDSVTLQVPITHTAGLDAITVSGAVIIGADGAPFSTTLAPLVLNPGQSALVPITFTPDAEQPFGSSADADGAAAISFLHSGRNSGVTLPLVGRGTPGSPTAVTGGGLALPAAGFPTWLFWSMAALLAVSAVVYSIADRRRR